MKKLFSWLLRRFITAFTILVVVQLGIYIFGFNMILFGYETNMLKQYEQAATGILTDSGDIEQFELPGNGPFFVFSPEQTLVFTNKGKGKSLVDSELRPVYHENQLLGYFHAGELGFTDNQSNRVFLISVIVLSGLAIILSIVIGFLSALFSSRRIAGPINILREDIHDIRLLKPSDERKFEISELTEMSKDIVDAGRTLLNQEEYKRQWLRDLAHDLRTPLSGLKSQLEALSDGVLEPTTERFRRHLLEIARLESLAASIGELTAVESREAIEKKGLDAESLAAMLISPWELELNQKKIRLELTVNTITVLADQQLLLRALGNILSNAVNYIEDGDFIGIRFSEVDSDEGKQSCIEIMNNGPDIAADQRELIFTRLYRGNSGRTSPGSGLGLSITREIIKLHGGGISVEEIKPRGVMFKISLPLT